jgi:hypothetical protein
VAAIGSRNEKASRRFALEAKEEGLKTCSSESRVDMKSTRLPILNDGSESKILLPYIDFGSGGVDVSFVERVDEGDVTVPPSVQYPVHTSTNAALWHKLIPLLSSVTGVRHTM